MFSKIAVASAALLATSSAAQVDEWKKRAVYQVLTDRFATENDNAGSCGNLSQYCGGTYKGMINHLDYIAGMGFDAIWISPVVDNQEPGYHGYWARDWNKTNDHFGSDQDLKDMVAAAHAKGMFVMVDVVANHVAPVGDNFSSINPFNSPDHYHSKCDIQDWSNQWQVENCRLADLPDLNQQNQWVRQQLKDWVGNLVKNYGFDGIRIDTIPEVPKDFWAEFGPASGVFQMGEVFNGDPAYVGGYQGPVTALFNYPMYYTIRDVFGSKKSMYGIKNRFNEEGGHFSDIDALGLFVDNHDNARFLNQFNDQRMFKNALTFALTSRGIPFYYYGSEQAYAGGNDPQNRESLWQDMNTNSDIYKMTAAINQARKSTGSYDHPVEEKYVMDNFYAYARGDMFVALTNSYDQVQYHVPNLPWADGTTVCSIFNGSDCQTIQGGGMDVTLVNGESKIYIPKTNSFFDKDDVTEEIFVQA